MQTNAQKKTPLLIPVQPSPQIPRPLHQLLILMLLHLQLPLPLHTNRIHLSSRPLLHISQPPLPHALPKRRRHRRLRNILQRSAARHVRDLAKRGGALLNRQSSSVCAFRLAWLWRRLSVDGHRDRWRGGVEGLVATRQDVLREGDGVLGVEVGDVVWLGGEGGAEGLVGAPGVGGGGAVQGADGAGEGGEDVGDAVGGGGGEDGGEGRGGDGFGEGGGDGDGAVEGEERRGRDVCGGWGLALGFVMERGSGMGGGEPFTWRW